jgi:hypothetical protein
LFTPPALVGFNGEVETTGRINLRRSCEASGTEPIRLGFRRNFEQIVGVLNALQEINCTGTVDCQIVNGAFESSGQINVWFAPAMDAVSSALRHLNEFGWQAARLSKDSRAEIHAMIIKTATRKAA